MVHWSSPRFHSYCPTGNSFPSICGEMLSGIFGCIGFSWSSCPASTDLEMTMLDWLGKMIDLPDEFLFSSNGKGGGVIQSGASESTLVALLSARNKAITAIQATTDWSRGTILEKLVYYTSTEVVGTLGTTSLCAFDNIKELGELCRKENLWFHIDASYAGAAFICPEFRYLLNGVQVSNKKSRVLLVEKVKNGEEIVKPFCITPEYVKYDLEEQTVDYRHWGITFGRRFRSLKMWFVFRMFGVSGLQAYIRKHVSLAHEFEDLVRKDVRFELIFPVTLGVVCFRLK
ncbi:aromatic-L-amino-acid decarboxylase-like, partial [Limulus polyphemus]|uniref:Aromatic-L-amino-acid decarboxylase n=1 Tax=Limulus polyphemus TaxID=6850 RepID=A0ABM1C2A7_LIMPO